MAAPRIRCPVVYAGSDKIAELQTFKYKMSSGREAEFTVEGYLAHSDGNVMTGLTAEMVQTVAGISFDYVRSILNAADVSIGIPVNGEYHTVTMSVLNGEVSGDAKGNTCKASIDLEGGVPQLAA